LIQAILTDIEGTTTSLSFVHDVLFPYARKALPAFIRNHSNDEDVKEQMDALRDQQGRYLNEQQIIDLLLHWMDEDRKDPVLKSLQGMIWRDGYIQGDFAGHVYEDAARRLRQWQDSGLTLAIFSSGSVPAQKLLFEHSDFGDLTPLFSYYFDTRTGAKREAGAYKTIAGVMKLPPSEILFLSDVVEELNAARSAGMQTTQLVRESQAAGDHPVATGFDEIDVQKQSHR
jgi:enolase-phosphatase E1